MYWTNNNPDLNSSSQKRAPIRRRKPVPPWLWRAGLGSLLFLTVGIIGFFGLILWNQRVNAPIALSRVEKAVASITKESIAAVAASTLTPVSSATPTATLAPITNAAGLGTPKVIEVSSKSLSAVYLDYDLTLGDGLADWPEGVMLYDILHTLYVSDMWDESDDLTAVFQLSYNDQFLYIATTVTDDIHVQTRIDEWIGSGETIELLIDAQRIEDISSSISPDDFQILLSPGDATIQVPQANFVRQGDATGTFTDIGQVDDIQMGVVQMSNGYQLEAGIPWTLLGITPESGKLLGIRVSANDSDAVDNSQVQFKSMLSAPSLTDPFAWGELTLE